MKYTKSFISFKEQIELLEQRGVEFKRISKDKAEERISHINYFKLSGYIKKFAITNDNYSCVDFQEILDLYYFDKELRNVLFHSIEKIEISFKTKLAYYIAQETKEKGATSYIDLENWVNKNKVINKRNNSPWTKEEKIAFKEKSYEFQKKIKQYTQRGKNNFINNYFMKYEEIFLPIWMVVEVIDFGMAVQMYSLAKQGLREKVANTYKLTSKDLEFYLRSLKLIRNISAHNGILWDIKLINKINKPIIKQYESLIDDNKLMAVLIIIKELILIINKEYDLYRIYDILIDYFSKYPEHLKVFGVKSGKIEDLKKILVVS